MVVVCVRGVGEEPNTCTCVSFKRSKNVSLHQCVSWCYHQFHNSHLLFRFIRQASSPNTCFVIDPFLYPTSTAAADEKLKEQGVLLNPKAEMSAGEQRKFNKAVESIEKESFAPAAFTSNRDNTSAKEVRPQYTCTCYWQPEMKSSSIVCYCKRSKILSMTGLHILDDSVSCAFTLNDPKFRLLKCILTGKLMSEK